MTISKGMWIFPMLILCFTLCVQGETDWQDEFREMEARLPSLSGKEKLALYIHLLDRTNFPRLSAGKFLQYAPEAIDLARRLGDRKSEGRALGDLGYAYYLKGDYQKALICFHQSRAVFSSIPDIGYSALMNFEIGNIFLYCISDVSRAIDYYRKSESQYREIGRVYDQVKSWNLMGEAYRKICRYDEAASCYVTALKLGEGIDSSLMSRKRAIILGNLSDIYMQLEDYSQSRQYLKRAEDIYIREHLTQERAGVISRLGDISRKEGRYDEALQNYFQALRIREKGLDHIYETAELHRIAETHSLSGRFQEAEEYFRQTLDLRKKLSDIPGIVQTLIGLGLHCKRQGRLQEALKYFYDGLEIAKKNGLVGELMHAYAEVADIHARNGEKEKALQFRILHDEAREAVQSPKITARVMKILMQYEKEEELESLSRKKRRSSRFYFLMIVLLALCLALVFLIARRRIGKARRTVIAKENELLEQRSQLDLLKLRLKELENASEPSKYRGSQLSPEIARIYLEKLILAMEKDHLYLENNLTLGSLAHRFNINRTYLSQVINESTGKKFNDFINDFRIDEAKRQLAEEDLKFASVLDVGFAVGFQSKSNFYKVFRKITGMTPLDFREKQKNG